MVEDFQTLNSWSHHCCSGIVAAVVVGASVRYEHLPVSMVVVMQLLEGERVWALLQQHDLKVGEHYAANAVVDHRKGHLEIPTNTRNQRIISLLGFYYFSPMLIKIKFILSFCYFHEDHNSQCD